MHYLLLSLECQKAFSKAQVAKSRFCVLAVLFIAAFNFPITSTFAQRQANIWHFGDSIRIDFSTGVPVRVSGSSLWSSEGSASYCDQLGNLLFYTNGGGRDPLLSGQDGGHIWNRNNDVMYDMKGIEGGGFSSSQSSVVLEAPGQPGMYYLFTMDELEFNFGASPATIAAQPNGRGFRYFKIDMSQNNGLGSVVSANQPVYEPSAEGLCAIRHANGVDFWVLINQDSTGIGVYSVTSTGVNFAGVFIFPFLLQGIKPIKSSPNGDYVLAQLSLSANSAPLHLFQFNNATGVLSNPILLAPGLESGEFSPNSRYLYGVLSGTNPGQVSITQYDLFNSNIPASAVNIANSSSFLTSPQLGPDGKIYMVTFNFLEGKVELSRINCPNTQTPTFESAVISFTDEQFFCLPNFPSWIFKDDGNQFVSLGPDTLLLCDTTTSITLDAHNTGATYLWSNGDTTQRIIVNTPGIYYVTVTGPCGTGTDTVLVQSCITPESCDLLSSSDTIFVCGKDTVQLQVDLSAFSNISGVRWTGGAGKFIPSDTVPNARYVPTDIELARGFLKLSIRVNSNDSGSGNSGKLIAYDHLSEDLAFYISPLDGSIDTIQSNLGDDWLAMGFEGKQSKLHGITVSSALTNIDIKLGIRTFVSNIGIVQFFAGEYDNVNSIFYATGLADTVNTGQPVDQFLFRVNTSNGEITIVGNLNLFSKNQFYSAPNDGINGLAYDPDQNILYGVSDNGKLFKINPTNASTTIVGPTQSSLRGLAYDEITKKLWGINQNATLYEIDKNTGSIINTVPCKESFSNITSLTFAIPGKVQKKTCSDTLHIIFAPNNFLNLGSDTLLCSSESLNLLQSGYTNYLWQDGSTSSSYSVSKSGEYVLKATSKFGCVDTDTIKVQFVNCDSLSVACTINLPNVFTPNLDGVNDDFFPSSICQFDSYEFRIYNRWGQHIFATSNPSEKWNGKYKDTDCSDGVYFYIFNYKLPNKNSASLNGTVTLLR